MIQACREKSDKLNAKERKLDREKSNNYRQKKTKKDYKEIIMKSLKLTI